MGGNPTLIAKAIYDYAAGNATREASVRTARDTLITGGALTRGGMNDILSANKGGVSYSVMQGMSAQDQLLALNLAVAYIDGGARPSSRAVSQF